MEIVSKVGRNRHRAIRITVELSIFYPVIFILFFWRSPVCVCENMKGVIFFHSFIVEGDIDFLAAARSTGLRLEQKIKHSVLSL